MAPVSQAQPLRPTRQLQASQRKAGGEPLCFIKCQAQRSLPGAPWLHGPTLPTWAQAPAGTSQEPLDMCCIYCVFCFPCFMTLWHLTRLAGQGPAPGDSKGLMQTSYLLCKPHTQPTVPSHHATRDRPCGGKPAGWGALNSTACPSAGPGFLDPDLVAYGVQTPRSLDSHCRPSLVLPGPQDG